MKDETDTWKHCLKLLVQLAEEFAAGTHERTNRMTHRDDLLVKFRLAAKVASSSKAKPKEKCSPKKKAGKKVPAKSGKAGKKVPASTPKASEPPAPEPPAPKASIPMKETMSSFGVPMPTFHSGATDSESSD